MEGQIGRQIDGWKGAKSIRIKWQYYGTRMDRIKSGKDNKLNDRGRNSCELKLMSAVVKCKDIGMNREKVEDMINKVVDEVFGEE